MLHVLVLVFALSIDAFVSGFSYGAKRIRIPRASVLLISAICSALLAVAIVAGTFFGTLLSPQTAKLFSFLILLLLGISKLFDSGLKALIRAHAGFSKKWRFSFYHVRFILNIYADPEIADQDRSQELSIQEAACLALALSLDSLGAGFGVGFAPEHSALTVFLSFVATAACILSGGLLGRRLATSLNVDLSWVSGALLLCLAFLRLL